MVEIDATNIPIYLPYNSALVNAMQFTGTEDIASCAEEIFSKSSQQFICFNIVSEGIPYNQTNTVQQIIKYLIEKYNYQPSNFRLILGASPCQENINYYLSHCDRFNWVKIPVYFTNTFETFQQRNLLAYDLVDTTPRLKSKKFVCYNRNVKPHRLYITTEIINRGLLDKGFLSNFFTFPDDEFMFYCLHEDFPNKYKNIIDTFNNNKELFPISLGITGKRDIDNADRLHSLTPEDFDHFNETYFAIITESKFFHDDYNNPNTFSQLSLDAFFFTEKLYKFIAGKKPFILAGFTGSLKNLRSFGYKTFHPYIDETYDTIDNDEERVEAICNEIERLCKLSDTEILEWQRNVEPIILHNYQHFCNAGQQILYYLPKS